MRQLLIVLAAVIGAAFSCDANSADCGSLAPMRWLLGEWLADGQKSTWRETWNEVAPGTWEGRGTESSKSEPATSSSEDLRLVEMGGGVFYVAKVGHNELPVAFRLVECGGDRLAFANPSHDFPKRLEYSRGPDDRLRVHVSDGAENSFTLDFARQAAAAPDAATVLAAEDARFAAMVAADPAAMRRAFAEDLHYVHSTGGVAGREQLVDEIRSGKLRYLAITPAERAVSFLHPDAAVVHGQARIRASAGSNSADFQARYLAIYVLEAGAWRLRAWQSLRLP